MCRTPEAERNTREQADRAYEMYQAYLRGMSMREVGRLYGIGPERVRQIFYWNGLPRRSREWSPPGPRRG